MKNRKLIIWLTVAIVIIALAISVFAKKAKAEIIPGTSVIPGTLPGNDTTPVTGSTPKTTNTGSVTGTIGTETVSEIVGSWYNWIVGTGVKPTGTVYTDAYSSAAFPLKYGSRGEEVKNLQKWLNDHVIIPYALLTVDGIFGDNTLAAVKRTLNTSQVTESWYRSNILKMVM